jgi:lipopolysaccharide transport system ATP-binding protein
MARPAIRIQEVSKRYRLGTGHHGNLSQTMEDLVRSPVRRLLGRPIQTVSPLVEEEFWALRDVSFDVEEGTVVGLIGANGAGKSTLLKILARITPPTEGRVELRGRTGSLLEVGTGFHPELTGRENIFLNGAVLGMRRQEIARRYAEIVEFSGVERFIDTPVKRYSSGMYVRLAFSVAVHLEADILLLDEVLAVGDAEFQRKCMEKVEATVAAGRTVVFVSHGLGNIQRICSRVLLLESGRITGDGKPEPVVTQYVHEVPQVIDGVSHVPEGAEHHGTGEALLRRVAIRDLEGNATQEIRMGEPIRVTGVFEVFERIERATFELCIYNVSGEQILSAHSIDGGEFPVDVEAGMQEVTVELDPVLLPHEYQVGMALHRMTGRTVEHVDRGHSFKVLNEGYEGEPDYPWPFVRGYVRSRSTWSDVRSATSTPALAPEP